MGAKINEPCVLAHSTVSTKDASAAEYDLVRWASSSAIQYHNISTMANSSGRKKMAVVFHPSGEQAHCQGFSQFAPITYICQGSYASENNHAQHS